MTASGHSASSGFSINSSPSALVSTNTVRPFTAHRLHQDDDDIDDIENDEDPVIRNLKESHRNNNHDNELLPQESRERAPAQEAVAMTPVPAASAPMPSTTSTQEPKMTTSAAHRRLQDVLNGGKTNPVTPEKPSILPPPPIPSSHPRRTPANQSLPPPRLLRRSSSAIRLTTNLEGRATVVLEDEPEPASSPPKPPPTPAPRSAKRRPQSTPVDSKLWEFCCDSQSALLRSPQRTPPQPSEATQALRLLRTRRSTLGSAIVPALPRTLSQSQPTTTNQQFLKPTSKKPKPQTLQPPPPPSSVSKKTPAKRLRKVITTAKKAARPKPLSNNPSKDFAIFEQSLDSDKENRPPGAPASPPPEPKRRVLGMSGKGSLNATTATPSKKTMKGKSLYAGPSARKTLGERQQGRHEPDEGYGASQETQCGGGAYEDDIEGDMHGASQDSGIAGGSPRRIDEMECVENLLSLRGGTWR